MKVQHHFPLTTLAATLIAVCAQAALADDAPEYLQNMFPESFISVELGHWTDDRPHEGMFDGMHDEGNYGMVNANIVKRDDATGTWMRFSSWNLGLDTVDVSASYEKQGDWGIGVEYAQIPRQNPVTINTALQGIGKDTQTITPVTNPSTTRDNANNKDLDLERDIASLIMFKRFSPNLEFRVNFRNEEKDGNRQWGVRAITTYGSSSSYPAFIAEPIDSTTRQLDALLNYTSDKLQLKGGYYGSWYNNHNNRLDVIGTGGGYTEMSLPPDNQAHQGYLEGNYAFTPTTRGMFRVAYTHATQNDSFINTNNNGYTDSNTHTIQLWAPTPYVGSSLHGEVNTTEVMMGLTAKPIKNLSLLANVRYWDREDDTPVRIDAYSRSSSTGAITETYHNNPFDNAITTGKVEGNYSLPDGYSVIAGVDYSHQNRDISNQIVKTTELFVPYRGELDEWTYRADLRKSLSDQLNGSVGFAYSSRDGSPYQDVNTSVDSAYIHPFYIADRDRKKWKMALDWTPIDPLGIQLSFSDSQDEYPNSGDRQDGVHEGHAQLWSIDANYAINEMWKINAWYSHDTNNIDQVGPLSPAPNEWKANLDDKGDTLGAGVTGKLTSKLTVGANYDWVRTRSKYNQSGTATPLPDIKNRLQRVSLYGAYDIQKHSTISLDLTHEEWKTNDWTWEFADGSSYRYSTDGTMVINDPKQDSNFVGIRYTYKFQ
jgi:MtrB/PioB family decaheme-associated outer membrane protein